MNAAPSDLSDFDFCWSASAFEHFGSIDQGLAFIERIIECLKPGGRAVHTTELNVSSNDDTVAEGPPFCSGAATWRPWRLGSLQGGTESPR